MDFAKKVHTYVQYAFKWNIGHTEILKVHSVFVFSLLHLHTKIVQVVYALSVGNNLTYSTHIIAASIYPFPSLTNPTLYQCQLVDFSSIQLMEVFLLILGFVFICCISIL